jgi:glycosyltransferase involved in cell wall biosynthesis
LKVAVITANPTPYRTPFFAHLARREDLEVKVFFLTRASATRPWHVQLEGFEHEFLREFSIPVGGKDRARYRINPGIIGRLARGKFDAVVIAGYNHFTTQAAILYCTATRKPWCLMSESHIRKERGVLKKALKKVFLKGLLSQMGAAMVTGTLAARYMESLGVPADAVFVVANTPDVERLKKASEELSGSRERIRADLGVSGKSVVLFVGRLLPEKGLSVLFDAYGKVQAGMQDTALLVAGDGPMRGECKRRVRDDRLEDVSFLGFVSQEELPEVYVAADVFALPSLVEPWGVVVNEAMACGLPVLLSDRVGASADLVEEGVNGFVVGTGDARALSEAILEVLSDENRRAEMGMRSREIISDWDYATSARNFAAAVECALRRRQRP